MTTLNLPRWRCISVLCHKVRTFWVYSYEHRAPSFFLFSVSRSGIQQGVNIFYIGWIWYPYFVSDDFARLDWRIFWSDSLGLGCAVSPSAQRERERERERKRERERERERKEKKKKDTARRFYITPSLPGFWGPPVSDSRDVARCVFLLAFGKRRRRRRLQHLSYRGWFLNESKHSLPRDCTHTATFALSAKDVREQNTRRLVGNENSFFLTGQGKTVRECLADTALMN